MQQDGAPMSAHPCFTVLNTLSIHDGFLFKGDIVVIPASLHRDMLHLFHPSHIGMEGSIRRARESFY